MALGKTIRVYLVDGSSTGPIIAEVINWTGQVMVVPRAQLSELARREELQRVGVYLLIGPDTETLQDRVYIGEGDDVFSRLKSHDKDESKEFWTRALTVTSKDFNLTKAHGRYLESRLVEAAASSRRAIVTNVVTPPPKTLPEPDVADMEYFIEQIRLIFPVLGVDVLRPLPTRVTDAAVYATPLLLLREVGVVAKAREIDGQFIVLKGSTARRQHQPSWEAYVAWRDNFVAEGKLVVKDDTFFSNSLKTWSSPAHPRLRAQSLPRSGVVAQVGSYQMGVPMRSGRKPK